MKRIFIALKIIPDKKLSALISTLQAGLKNEKISWTNPDNIHITIAFLGDTEQDKITEISGMISERCRGLGCFDISLVGAGLFRSVNDPRVIWAGISESTKLRVLNSIIKAGLRDIGIKIEDRDFNPHLTLGRIKSINDKDNLKKVVDKSDGEELQVVSITEVILFESILQQTGPVYKPLARYSLI
jgi:2'-5' RNA ligase